MKKIISKSKKIIPYILYKTIEKEYYLSERNVFYKQEKVLNRTLMYAVNHCNYYKNMALNKKDLCISDFPLVDRHIITEFFDDFCSDMKDWYFHGDAYTGGSTGEPFHLLVGSTYENEFGAKRWKVYGYKNGDTIMALDGTKIPDDLVRSGVFWKQKNKENIPFGTIALSSLYINENNARTYCEYILNTKPAFIRGYPSFVFAIAQYSKQLGLKLSGFLKGIELTSETVNLAQIETIREVFGAPVYLQYGHTEACICAYTYDESYKYRVEPLYGFVEILDVNNNHVKEGEVGEVVVTSLHNFAMPLIRYKTGDFAEYGGKDNRYIYINKVLGRTQDYIYDCNGNKVLLTALIFGQHFKALGHMVKWQIEQYVQGKIILHIIKGKEYTIDDEKEITKIFNTLGHVDIMFDYCQSIYTTPRGKSKMLIQHIQL